MVIARTTFIQINKNLTTKKIKAEYRKKALHVLCEEHFSVRCRNVDYWKGYVGQIREFEMWGLRQMLKISWTENVTNEEVLARNGRVRDLEIMIMKKKTRYCEHLLKNDSRMQKTLVKGNVEGKREQGRGANLGGEHQRVGMWSISRLSKESAGRNNLKVHGRPTQPRKRWHALTGSELLIISINKLL